MNKELVQKHRRERLEALAAEFGGYAALGRALGFRDGAFISQMCKGKRNITEDFVTTCHQMPKYEDWFFACTGVFTSELVLHLKELPQADQRRMENLLRSALNLNLLR